MRLSLFYASWRRLVNNCPENTKLPDGVHKLMEIDWFYDIRIHAQSVTRHHIFLFMGRCKHDDGYHFELFIRFNLLQHFQSIDLRQFQIEEHDRGVVIRARLELPPAIEIIQGLLAVGSDYDLVGEVVFLQG